MYLLATTLDILISAILFIMFIRAILSFIMFDVEGNPLMNILYAVTDAVTAPVRLVCDRMGWFQGVPIDVPHMITLVLLLVLQLLIPEVRL